MRRDDMRFAAAARDDGIHKISKFTWRAGAAGVVCSALIAVAFGHHVASTAPGTGGGARSQQSTAGKNGGGSNQGSGGIVVPSQPPAPSQGGGQVTSGAS
jgi:hypothetical protein